MTSNMGRRVTTRKGRDDERLGEDDVRLGAECDDTAEAG